MPFQKYMHVERFGNAEVRGIELGECYVFPKLDGTNGSLWWEDGICAGSRNRQLSLEADNAGFLAWAQGQRKFVKFFAAHPDLRLFGEWLVPHSLKTYEESAWREFYVFDVMRGEKLLSYKEYEPLCKEFEIEWIAPLCVMRNAEYSHLVVELQNNKYLIKEGQGVGEGIVVKNYLWQNSHGNQVWAKLVTNSFKEVNAKVMGATMKNMREMVEQEIVNKYVTRHLVEKVYAKIANAEGGWQSKFIPRLLQTVFYDLVKEETWEFVKEMKLPTVNFKTLGMLTTMKVKELLPEVF